MNNKTCATCIDNDNGLCDCKGILIQEDDTCDRHREDWRQQMLSEFIEMDIKYCPDLTGYEEVKAAFVGHGDFTRPILRECIKETCAAYKDGYCKKYHNKVEWEKNKNGNI